MKNENRFNKQMEVIKADALKPHLRVRVYIMKRISLIIVVLVVAVGVLRFAMSAHAPPELLEELKTNTVALRRVEELIAKRIKASSLPSKEKDLWENRQSEADELWHRAMDAQLSTIEYIWWGGSGSGAASVDQANRLTKHRIETLETIYEITQEP